MRQIFGILSIFLPFAPCKGQTPHIEPRINSVTRACYAGTLGKTQLAFDERIWAVKFSADGKNLLTVTDTIDCSKWYTGDKRNIWSPRDGETMIRALFSPDGSHFARDENGSRVHVHESLSGKLLHTFEGRDPRFTASAWSPDGSVLAVGVGHEVVFHDLKTGRIIRRIAAGDKGIADIEVLAWSPDGKWMAVGTKSADHEEGALFLIELDGEKKTLLPGTLDFIISFAPDSRTLAVYSGVVIRPDTTGYRIYGWDIPGGKETEYEMKGGCNTLVYSPDGRYLAVGGVGGARILDARKGVEIAECKANSHNEHVWSAAFSPDGKVFAMGVDIRIQFQDTQSWNEINPDDTLRASVTAMAFSADGGHLVTGGMNGDLVLWDWRNKSPVWKKLAPAGLDEIKALSVDPSSRRIGVVQGVSAHERRKICFVDFGSGETTSFVESFSTADAAPLFHANLRTAYIGTTEHTLALVDCGNGRILHNLPITFLQNIKSGASGFISSLDFDFAKPDVIRWTAETLGAGRIHALTGIESHTIDPRGTGMDDNPLPPRDHEFTMIGTSVWNMPSKYLLKCSTGLAKYPEVRHPSDLLQIMAGRVFDVLSQSYIASFDFGPGVIKSLALSPDGLTLVAGTTGGLRYCTLEGPPLAEGTSLETLWTLMGGDDHWMAYQAAWAMARQPGFIGFLETKIKPAREPSADQITTIKAMMTDGSHEVRQTAARLWLDLGYGLEPAVLATLRKGALPGKWPSVIPPGTEHHFEMLSRTTDAEVPPLIPLSEHRRSMRAVMLLVASRDLAAKKFLKILAEGHAASPLTRACKRWTGGIN